MGEKFDVPEAESFCQGFDAIVQYKGKATELFNEIFDINPKRGSGIRWWIKWEQLVFLNDVGIKNIVDDFAMRCISEDASPKSATKLIEMMDDLAVRGKIYIQLQAIVDLGRPFC